MTTHHHAGSFLRAVREDAGLTQDQVARLAHSSQPVISRIERGHISPTVGLLAHLLRAIGYTLVLDYVVTDGDTAR